LGGGILGGAFYSPLCFLIFPKLSAVHAYSSYNQKKIIQ
jgi:hypothetical protein